MDDIRLRESIKVGEGYVLFPAYKGLKSQAEQVAQMIREMEVSEESIKEAKKLLAEANKSVKALEDTRISIKKQILAPYDTFEAQVKEITGIVKEAEQEVRGKVRELEELERDRKEDELRDIWDLRFRPYAIKLSFLTFEDWLTPQHLNKTVSLKKAEEEMAQWLEAKSRDVMVMMGMEYGIDILSEYKSCLDLGLAVATVKQRVQQREEIKRVIPTVEQGIPVTIFIVEDPKDATLTEMLLKQNNINYKKETK